MILILSMSNHSRFNNFYTTFFQYVALKRKVFFKSLADLFTIFNFVQLIPSLYTTKDINCTIIVVVRKGSLTNYRRSIIQAFSRFSEHGFIVQSSIFGIGRYLYKLPKHSHRPISEFIAFIQ